MDTKVRSERNWVLAWAAIIVLLSSLPYLWGMGIAPSGFKFLGLTHNIDDGAVYLSWMRQAADGHFFIRNLFTSDPQAARQFNVLFLLMGNVARLTHLSLISVFHLFRILLSIGFLLLVWQFSKLFLQNSDQRRLLIPIIGLSAGVGWLFPGAQAPTGPVDMWQPEAITFLSMYLNPLFMAGLLLMLGAFYFLVLAERSKSVMHAVYAGLLLLLLGNIHTYDVITVGCIWAAYVVVLSIVTRKVPTRLICLSLLVALIAVPSVAYQFYLYRVDDVFKARANSPTPSPEIWSFFAGYGLVLIGAVIGCILSIRSSEVSDSAKHPVRNNRLMLMVWAVVGFALPYIPVGQQRKLIMGLHIPLCILCAYGLSHLLKRFSQDMRRAACVLGIIVMAVSNIQFMAKDISLLNQGDTAPHYAAFITDSQLHAMDYLRRHSRISDVIFAPPSLALFTPAIAGRQVYYGHWSETPDYAEKIKMWAAFMDESTPDEVRAQILKESAINYCITVDTSIPFTIQYSGAKLETEFSDDTVTVFKVARF